MIDKNPVDLTNIEVEFSNLNLSDKEELECY